MNKEQKIEEMAGDLRTRRYENLGLGLCDFKCRDCNNFCVERDYAKQLVEEGYRKQNEVAKEIRDKIISNKHMPEPVKNEWKKWFNKEYGVEIEK